MLAVVADFAFNCFVRAPFYLSYCSPVCVQVSPSLLSDLLNWSTFPFSDQPLSRPNWGVIVDVWGGVDVVCYLHVCLCPFTSVCY